MADERVAITRDDLVTIAGGLGLPMNGIEVVSSADLVRWCVLCSEAWVRAREEGREAELANPIAMGDAIHAEMQRRTTEAIDMFARAEVPAVIQLIKPFWKN